MKNIALAAIAGSLTLAACAEADEPAEAAPAGDTTVINEAPPVTTTETIVTEEPADGSSLTIDGGDVDATISEDGVQADINVD